jgi:hypothetical protein
MCKIRLEMLHARQCRSREKSSACILLFIATTRPPSVLHAVYEPPVKFWLIARRLAKTAAQGAIGTLLDLEQFLGPQQTGATQGLEGFIKEPGYIDWSANAPL